MGIGNKTFEAVKYKNILLLAIENYANLFISHIIEDIKDVKSDYKHIVKQIAEKMLEEIK